MDDARLAELNARFGTDPDALEWARGNVEKLRDKYHRFGDQAAQHCKPEQASMWRQRANLLDMELIGGAGCVIAPFDVRRPDYAELLAATARMGGGGEPGGGARGAVRD